MAPGSGKRRLAPGTTSIALSSKPRKCCPIEFDHREVIAANHEEGGSIDLIECITSKIGTAATRYDGTDAVAEPRCRYERSRCSRA